MSGMNENNTLYRLFINFCVTTVIGLLAVILEYSLIGEGSVAIRTLWYVIVSGAVIGIVFEVLFVNILPLSGGDIKRNVLWRNRVIAAVVNAVIVAVLGKMMLGSGNILILLLISILVFVAAVIISGLVSDRSYRRSIAEMNRRLKELNSTSGGHREVDGE